jgi:hypothetical protein
VTGDYIGSDAMIRGPALAHRSQRAV